MRLSLLPVIAMLGAVSGCYRVANEAVWQKNESCSLVDRTTATPPIPGYGTDIGLRCGDEFILIVASNLRSPWAAAVEAGDGNSDAKPLSIVFGGCAPNNDLERKLSELNKRTSRTGFRFSYYAAHLSNSECTTDLENMPGVVSPKFADRYDPYEAERKK